MEVTRGRKAITVTVGAENGMVSGEIFRKQIIQKLVMVVMGNEQVGYPACFQPFWFANICRK